MSEIKKYIGTLLLLLTAISGSAQRNIQIEHLSGEIVIDGAVDEAAWLYARPTSGFIQMEPQSGEPGSSKTAVFVGQNEKALYIAAVLYFESEPIARVQNRDALSESDDSFILLLDTYNDNRTGYGFWVNPLGTQADFRLTDDGRSLDLNWDAEWESAAQVYDNRWVVEIAVPFTSLKYDQKIDTWGINFGRLIRANYEKSWWSGLLTEDFRISQGGRVSGINSPKRRGNLILFPYATVRQERLRGIQNDDRTVPDAGLDMRWRVNTNITADATLNPDFATVEADQEQVNLTRYELDYPEKRLFFQEGNEMYNTRINTFYSRRIQDILYGAKLHGKTGPYQFNAMNVRTLANENEAAYYLSTARVKRDFLESSTLGMTAVDKRTDSSYVSTFSGDYLLNLGRNWKLTGQLVASLPGDFLSHSAWFARFAHESNIHHVHFRYTEMGENFRKNVNQVGFIRDDNRREMDADFTYRWWLNNKVIRYVDAKSRNNIFWSRTNGDLRSWYITAGMKVYFENKINLEYDYNNEYKLFDKSYYNYRHIIEIGYNTEEWSNVEVEYQTGYNFDRDFWRIEGSLSFKLTEQFAVSYTADYLNFSPDPEGSTTFINVLNFNYNFTRDLWVELFGQTRTNTSKFYLYGKMGWRFRPPFGALYLIYSHDQESLLGYREQVDALFLKLTLPIGIGNK